LRGTRTAVAFEQPGDIFRALLELGAGLRSGAIAAAGDHQRARPRRVAQAEVQGGEAAHRQTDDVCLFQLQVIHDGEDVVGRALLGIAGQIVRYVRGRVTARVVGDAAVASREVANLRFPAAAVAGELVYEHDGKPAPGFLVVQLDSVISLGKRHGGYSIRQVGEQICDEN